MVAKKFKNIFSVLVSVCVLGVGVLSGCGDSYVRFEEGAQILADYDNGVSEGLKFNNPATTVQISGWLDESCVKNLMAFLAEEYPDYTFEYRYIILWPFWPRNTQIIHLNIDIFPRAATNLS